MTKSMSNGREYFRKSITSTRRCALPVKAALAKGELPLIDADIYGPSAPLMFDIREAAKTRWDLWTVWRENHVPLPHFKRDEPIFLVDCWQVIFEVQKIARNIVSEVAKRNENLPPTEIVRITTMAGCSTKLMAGKR